MPVAPRPDPLLALNSPNPSPSRAVANGPMAGPGSFSNALAQAQPSPVPERQRDAGVQREPAQARQVDRPAERPASDADAKPAAESAPKASTPVKRVSAEAQRPKAAQSQGSEPSSVASSKGTDPESKLVEGAQVATGSQSVDEPSMTPTGDGLVSPISPPAQALDASRRIQALVTQAGEPPAAALAQSDPEAKSASLRPVMAHLPAPITLGAGPTDDESSSAGAPAERDGKASSPATARRALTSDAEKHSTLALQNAMHAATASSASNDAAAHGRIPFTSEMRQLAPLREGLLSPGRIDAPLPMGVGGTATLGTASQNSLSPMASASIGPSLNHPDFAQALGAQVAVWAVNGQHEAELHLNPGSMGPVQGRIGIEGAQAQVRFAADLAPTREVLSAALPQLEAALAREGLQLSGADVQARNGGAGGGSLGNGAGDAGRGRTARGSDHPMPMTEHLDSGIRHTAARGLLDLYA